MLRSDEPPQRHRHDPPPDRPRPRPSCPTSSCARPSSSATPARPTSSSRRLLDFVEEQEFDHVGVFTYSPEPGTKAVTLDLPAVPAEVAEERRNAIMEAQQAISLRKNRALVGQTLQVLIEAIGEAEDEAGDSEPISVGRARRHAPEVDGLVFVPGTLPIGELIDLEIAEAGPYDLWAHRPGARRRSRRGGGSTASTRCRNSLSSGRADRNDADRRRGFRATVNVLAIPDPGHNERLPSPIDLEHHTIIAHAKTKALTSLQLPDPWIPDVFGNVIEPSDDVISQFRSSRSSCFSAADVQDPLPLHRLAVCSRYFRLTSSEEMVLPAR